MKAEEKVKLQAFTLDNKPVEIDALGSLGILAFGYRGLLAWREKREALKQESSRILISAQPRQNLG